MSLRARMFAQPPASAAPGQVVFEPPNQISALDQSWVVPTGVTSICACIVSAGGETITLKKNGVLVMSRSSFSQSGCDGGGNGGVGGGSGGGGGGAGGYSGPGGNAGVFLDTPPVSDGTAGSGGGGGGGGGGHRGIHPNPDYGAGDGGGVGLKGAGASGLGGAGASFSTPSSNGTPGSGGSAFNLNYGGGFSAIGSFGRDGGGLGYKNAIAVTPGDVIRIEAPVPFYGANNAGARIIWGAGRSYPSAAGDV